MALNDYDNLTIQRRTGKMLKPIRKDDRKATYGQKW